MPGLCWSGKVAVTSKSGLKKTLHSKTARPRESSRALIQTVHAFTDALIASSRGWVHWGIPQTTTRKTMHGRRF